jgi:hypothetical protein
MKILGFQLNRIRSIFTSSVLPEVGVGRKDRYMFEQNAAVLDEILAPAEEKHPVSRYAISEWASHESIDLTTAAFDVIVASHYCPN